MSTVPVLSYSEYQVTVPRAVDEVILRSTHHILMANDDRANRGLVLTQCPLRLSHIQQRIEQAPLFRDTSGPAAFCGGVHGKSLNSYLGVPSWTRTLEVLVRVHIWFRPIA